jgi:hypothetical protein
MGYRFEFFTPKNTETPYRVLTLPFEEDRCLDIVKGEIQRTLAAGGYKIPITLKETSSYSNDGFFLFAADGKFAGSIKMSRTSED